MPKLKRPKSKFDLLNFQQVRRGLDHHIALCERMVENVRAYFSLVTETPYDIGSFGFDETMMQRELISVVEKPDLILDMMSSRINEGERHRITVGGRLTVYPPVEIDPTGGRLDEFRQHMLKEGANPIVATRLTEAIKMPEKALLAQTHFELRREFRGNKITREESAVRFLMRNNLEFILGLNSDPGTIGRRYNPTRLTKEVMDFILEKAADLTDEERKRCAAELN